MQYGSSLFKETDWQLDACHTFSLNDCLVDLSSARLAFSSSGLADGGMKEREKAG